MQSWTYTWLTIFIPLIVGAVFYRKFNRSHRFLYFFVVIGFLTELTTQYLRHFTDVKNNMPVGHMYISLSFFFIAIFYLIELKGYVKKKIVASIILIYAVFSILNILFIQSYYDYPSATGATSALILVVFSILLFSKIMTEGKIKYLSHSSLIWINTAVLIYYAGNFFFYILFNLILNHSVEFINKTLNFFKILYVIFYCLLSVGFWKAGTKPQEQ